MENLHQYLSDPHNSFEGFLQEWDYNQPLYPYLVLITRKNDLVIDSSPIFWGWRKSKGFFFKQDRIIPNENLDDSLIPQLYLKSSTRYYNIYEEDKHTSVTYTFYSKDACHKIYNFFDKGGEDAHAIKPFSYKEMLQLLGLTENPEKMRKWIMENMIVEEDIVGMMTIQAAPVFSGDNNQAVFVLLMKRPYEDQQPHIFDLYETFDFQKVFLQSKYLKSYTTKILAWAFIHDLKKGSSIEGLRIMNDENNTTLFEEYVRSHYDDFSDEKKNECVMVFPDIYENYLPSETIFLRLLTDNIMSMATIIKRWGIGGTFAASSIVGDENITKLMMNVAKKLFNNKSLIRLIPQDYWFPFITVLSFMNVMYNDNPKVKVPTGFWLYYYLYKYREKCQQEDIPLVDSITAFTLMNNRFSFMNLINTIKMNRCKTRVCESSWSTRSNEAALYELVFYYSNGCKGFWNELTPQEQQLWPKRWDDEIGYNELLEYFQGDGHHTFMGVEEERGYYANKLFEAIESEMGKGNFCMLEFN